MISWERHLEIYQGIYKLNKLDLPKAKYMMLSSMLSSGNSDDVNLALELINNLGKMTLEEKIILDNLISYPARLIIEHDWNKHGPLLLWLELNKQKFLYSESEFDTLSNILASKNLDDVNLAKQMISQGRTKRLRHERINKKSKVTKIHSNG